MGRSCRHCIRVRGLPLTPTLPALFGTSPETIINRRNDSLGPVMKGVRTEWVKSGRIIITHPDDVKEVSWPCWKGSLRFTYDLCGVKGEIDCSWN